MGIQVYKTTCQQDILTIHPPVSNPNSPHPNHLIGPCVDRPNKGETQLCKLCVGAEADGISLFPSLNDVVLLLVNSVPLLLSAVCSTNLHGVLISDRRPPQDDVSPMVAWAVSFDLEKPLRKHVLGG